MQLFPKDDFLTGDQLMFEYKPEVSAITDTFDLHEYRFVWSANPNKNMNSSLYIYTIYVVFS